MPRIRSLLKFITVESVLKIIQALVLVIGTFIAVNEFLIKDRDAQRARWSATLQVTDRLSSDSVRDARSALDKTRQVLQEANLDDPFLYFNNNPPVYALWELTDDLLRAYQTIHNCISSNYCDRRLVAALSCGDIIRDNSMIARIFSVTDYRFYAPVLSSLKSVVENLLPLCEGNTVQL